MRVLVTGATDGIGRQTAIDLARRGADVIVHGRSADKVQAVAREVGGEGVVADLGSLAAVRGLAAEVGRRWPELDVLLANAGVFETTRHVTPDGFERTFAVNHLAHFLLVRELSPLLRERPAPRVVIVASMAHFRGRIHWDDLQLERGFDGYAAYAQSKLANVMHAAALARREPRIVAHSLHPGVIGTKLLRAGFGMGGAPVSEGAATSVHVALSSDAATGSGRYWSDGKPALPSPLARDEAAQDRLWEVSEQIVG